MKGYLSSLRSVIRRILVESKVDDLQAKNPDVDVRALSASDPSPTKKYLGWMIKQVKSGVDEEEVTALVKAFDANAQRLDQKDINAYVSVSDLNAALSALPEKSKSQEKRSVKQEGSVKLYEDDESVVVRLDTKKAVQQYGSGTRWCITQEKESHYETYSSNNVVFYFVISKTRPQSDPLSKVAISIQRGLKNEILKTELFDATDETLSVKAVSERIGNFTEILKICEQDAVTRPMGSLAKLKNGMATEEEIEALYVGADVQTRKLIAQSEKTPARLLMILAKDEDVNVRINIATNRSAPVGLLSALAKDEDINVRGYASENLAKRKQNENIARQYISLIVEKIRTQKGIYSPFGDRFNLNKFKSLPSAPIMRQYAYMFLEPLGHGSSREVYTLTSRYALKIARSEKGNAQNEAEVDAFTNPQTKDVVAKVQSFDKDFNWVIADLVSPLKNAREFEQLTGINFEKFCGVFKAECKGTSTKEFNGSKFVKAVATTAKGSGLLVGDVCKIDSWGKSPDGRAVLLDYGFTRDVADKHYPLPKTPKTSASTKDHISEPKPKTPAETQDDPEKTGH